MTAARAYLIVAGGPVAHRVAEALQVDPYAFDPKPEDETSPQSPEAIRRLRERCREGDR